VCIFSEIYSLPSPPKRKAISSEIIPISGIYNEIDSLTVLLAGQVQNEKFPAVMEGPAGVLGFVQDFS
jgi:hypothetical protein